MKQKIEKLSAANIVLKNVRRINNLSETMVQNIIQKLIDNPDSYKLKQIVTTGDNVEVGVTVQ